MKITRYTHAAVVVEESGVKFAIDPGEFGAIEGLSEVDAILVTHDHFDHADHRAIQAALNANPAITVFGPESLRDAANYPVEIVDGGDSLTIQGVRVDVLGHFQARTSIYDPEIANVGYLVDGRLLHPGDAFQEIPAEILLLPMEVPWAKNMEREEYLKAFPPKQIIPIHDAPLGNLGIEFMQHTAQSLASRIGAEAINLRPGDSIEL
ncbi:MAG: MBL fold metallo-hydrolase [Actinomycetaceae bacterium]|nr:MBL fold metallo-hydrolase [Arcanobacterium sp.]MDD7504480.1 MBL fold metallo-hydrolase [Actinomycetaceae bacterium]MDY6142850.1 MBL fold metallo-hydrolase [Arcanobacterium sp.]